MSRARAAHWSIAAPHAWSEVSRRSERIDIEKTDRTMHSAGGVIMSARDAARWMELMVEDGRIDGTQVVPANVVRSTRTPLADVDDDRDGFVRKHYGLGWYIGSYRDDAMLHHFGAFPGARAHVSWLPDRHIGVAVFVNDSSVSAPVVDLIAKFVYDRLRDRARARAEFDAAVDKLAIDGPARWLASAQQRASRPWTLTRPRANYTGSYVSPLMGTIEVRLQGEDLRAELALLHAMATPFTEPDSMRVEFAPGQGEVLRFEFAEGASPVALIYAGARFERR